MDGIAYQAIDRENSTVIWWSGMPGRFAFSITACDTSTSATPENLNRSPIAQAQYRLDSR
jgi:hypothetical protein